MAEELEKEVINYCVKCGKPAPTSKLCEDCLLKHLSNPIPAPKEEIKYPKTYDKCPCCGSSKRWSEVIGVKVFGGQPVKGMGQPFPHPLESPKILSTTIPMAVPWIDICYDCGNVYAFEVAKVQAAVQMMPNQGPPQRGGGNHHGIPGIG
jgi:hypothetical protein